MALNSAVLHMFYGKDMFFNYSSSDLLITMIPLFCTWKQYRNTPSTQTLWSLTEEACKTEYLVIMAPDIECDIFWFKSVLEAVVLNPQMHFLTVLSQVRGVKVENPKGFIAKK